MESEIRFFLVPMAYKNKNDIIDVISDTVEIKEIIKPIYNYKASKWY
jgi:hypothetical protein